MTRKEAIDVLKGFRKVIGLNDDLKRALDKRDIPLLDMAIEALSAERTGEWVEVTNGRGGHECSECHSYAPSYASGDEHLSDYCPNCGAKMRGE